MNLYKDFPVITQVPQIPSNDADTLYKLPFLELLLANDAFIDQLDEQQCIELMKMVVEKYEKKIENSHVYNIANIKKTFLLGAVVISKHGIDSKTPEQQDFIHRFIDTYEQFHNADLSLLSEISKIISEL